MIFPSPRESKRELKDFYHTLLLWHMQNIFLDAFSNFLRYFLDADERAPMKICLLFFYPSTEIFSDENSHVLHAMNHLKLKILFSN
jgi:hypothetical protein